MSYQLPLPFYDEIRRAECLFGPAQIDRCVLLMSAPNEPYSRCQRILPPYLSACCQHALAACAPPFRAVHDPRDQAQQLRPILAMAPFTAHS